MRPMLPDRRLIALVLVAALALVPMRRAEAQTAPAAEPRVVDVDTTAYPNVSLLMDLPASTDPTTSVSVIENGRAIPAAVAGGGQGHLEVVLVMDTSGSMSGAPLDAAKTAATNFVSALPPGTSVAVVGFGAQPYVVTPMTADASVLQFAIARLTARGETALYDALSVGVDQFTPTPGPRSVVLVSDGGDTASTAPLDGVTARLVAAHARLFGVQLVTPEANRPVLDGLSAATKGRTVEAGDAAALVQTYQEVAADAVRQVRITYRSAAHGTTTVRARIGNGRDAPTVAVSIRLPDAPPAPPTTAAPAAAPEPRTTHAPSTEALWIGAGGLFLALFLASWLAVSRPPRSLLARERRPQGGLDLEDLKVRAGKAIERTLEQRGHRQKLGVRLENAGITLRPGEYVVVVAAVSAIGGLAAMLLGGPALALLVPIATVGVAWLLLESRTNKRRRDLANQVPDLLQQLTSGLRAGFGVMQAVEATSREIAAPMAEELHRLVTEGQLGRPLSESLRAMNDRVGGQDFDWVVQAIEINREVGGDLSEVLDAVAGTIRARNALRRQVKTLSAQGRLSARILLAMPFAMAVLLSVINPGYLSPFVTHTAGPVLLVVGAVFMVIGWVWMRRIVRPEF